MINFGRTMGWRSRRGSRETPRSSTLADRLDRYVANVSQPGRVLTTHERDDLRNRIEMAIGRD